MFNSYWLCYVDELVFSEHSWSLKICEQEVLSGASCEIGTVTLSLPISLCGSCNGSKIYEVTIWVAAKLPNHYCSNLQNFLKEHIHRNQDAVAVVVSFFKLWNSVFKS